VVLAEDDPALRALLAAALSHDGHEVVQAASGNEVIDRVRALVSSGLGVDLLVSDVRMPKLSGLSVLKLLRDAELDIPVILMSAFSDSRTRAEASQHGAVLLDKPVQLRVLRSEVERALEGGRGA